MPGSHRSRLQLVESIVVCVILLVTQFDPSLAQHSPNNSHCDLVELYPGYPGYRGMITGIRPVGDHACLNDLVREYPNFLEAQEDERNRAAARNLGLSGGFSDWTWENWMAIEVERGDAPHCYTCLILDQSYQAITEGAEYDPSDPRVLITLTDIRVLAPFLLEDIAEISNPGRFQIETIVWRTLASMVVEPLGAHLNASQVLENMKFWIGEYYGIDVNGDGTTSGPNLSYAQDAFEVMGGYTPMTGIEYLEDQVNEAASVIWMTYNLMSPIMQEYYLRGAEGILKDCESNAGSNGYETIGKCVAFSPGT